jgi:putative ABC transport system ATP-binding protein
LKSYPDRLSGGEQQRIAIVRSLVHDPALILADEPTGNLDLETGQQVLALLDNLASQRGKTLIMATHSREVIGKADRIVTIKDKGIVTITDGSHS